MLNHKKTSSIHHRTWNNNKSTLFSYEKKMVSIYHRLCSIQLSWICLYFHPRDTQTCCWNVKHPASNNYLFPSVYYHVVMTSIDEVENTNVQVNVYGRAPSSYGATVDKPCVRLLRPVLMFPRVCHRRRTVLHPQVHRKPVLLSCLEGQHVHG